MNWKSSATPTRTQSYSNERIRMKDTLKLIGVALLVLFVVGAVKYAVNPPQPQKDTSEPSYMGVTRQEYLDTASNKGQDTGAQCAYAHLIDTYGLEETYKMDKRALDNAADVDTRIYEAMEVCS